VAIAYGALRERARDERLAHAGRSDDEHVVVVLHPLRVDHREERGLDESASAREVDVFNDAATAQLREFQDSLESSVLSLEQFAIDEQSEAVLEAHGRVVRMLALFE
jgi:hypothetical protein